MALVSCLGASLTAGEVSANYLTLLAARPALRDFTFRNHGVNGELACNALQRLETVIEEKPEFVTILIGTNDVNGTHSERNFAYYREVHGITERPTLSSYEAAMRDIVERMHAETKAKVALLSLPPIGEDPDFVLFQKIGQYNEALHHVASETGADYLPVAEAMHAYLRAHEAERTALPPRLAYREGLHNIGTATALHAGGLSWNDISQRNGLLLLTDTIHLNETGAAMVADAIESWLLQSLPLSPVARRERS